MRLLSTAGSRLLGSPPSIGGRSARPVGDARRFSGGRPGGQLGDDLRHLVEIELALAVTEAGEHLDGAGPGLYRNITEPSPLGRWITKYRSP
ncbi:MAG: hypothetical protein ACRDTC_11355 [Pseudonocardiaceae bacterium]